MQKQQTFGARRNAPRYNNTRYNNANNGQRREKPRMNMVLEDDDQVDTVVMDRVTMNVADVKDEADELLETVKDIRKKVEETYSATGETSEETGLCGAPPVDVAGVHAMQPEAKAEEHAMQSAEELETPESRPTEVTMKVNAVKSEQKCNLFIKKGRINGRDVRILLDTGASTNMIKPGMASNVLLSRRLQAQRFDGTLTPATDVKHVEAPILMMLFLGYPGLRT
ncbi:hypothetical protein GN244_ATG07984 [Phytophthora infestans]|uniref:Peptidase A2 domain-containing protein n=1 Tax=Phytophthora infestans TaxID=4787 RepID=A0A833WF33_PHYIN|nr:hypothetical protein GN244_ATG07984 [Phytophthora infestans]